MAQSVSELSLGPTKAVTSWLTDQIAPAYWRPNSQILVWYAGHPRLLARAILLVPLCPVLSLFWEWGAEFLSVSSAPRVLERVGYPEAARVLFAY